ncbi:MAG: 4Fe-4S dicluster domain-containing protein [Candidatus Eisenbacteria bacterium]
MAEFWTLADLKTWARALAKSRRVIAPVAGPEGAVWAPVDDPEAISWDYGRTSISPRAWLLPQHETLFTYDLAADPPEIVEPPIAAPPTVLFLLRSCDVAGLRALDPVMRWDYEDEPYEERRKATLLVSLGCAKVPEPEACFCTSCGIDPRRAEGADVAIEPVDAGGETRYRVVALTDAGRESLAGAPGPIAEGPPIGEPVRTQAVDVAGARAWMAGAGAFEDPLWEKVAESCLGCGACAYVCPSCHCFDMVDEGDWRRGARVRNWDSCQFDHFTLHATGHNPRPHQWNRYRQRVYHKFVFYPEKFGKLLCTGCGRCVSACPGGMDLVEVLQRAAEQGEGAPAAAESEAGAGAKAAPAAPAAREGGRG